ncbi:MAG: hypothetical protein KC590_17015, partial [Nitrospira sp.]|nr:hypothetical protein [Nitrospira sp.]
MVPAYAYYLIHAYDLMKWLYGYGSGLRQNLDWDDFKRMPLVVPPPAEQHLIVRYLRHLEAKVKRYIGAKRKLIAALQEQKQAIIQQAVTRGLDPNVKLKPSGVEWLGEVPEHWEVVPFRALFTERDTPGGQDMEMLSVTIGRGVLRQEDYLQGSIKRDISRQDRSSYKQVRVSDLVYNKMRAWQ